MGILPQHRGVNCQRMKAWWAVLRRIEVVTVYALVFAIVLVPYGIHAKDQVSLSVTIIGLRSESGNVHIALYDEPKNFPYPDGMITKAEALIVAGVARYDFFVLKKRATRSPYITTRTITTPLTRDCLVFLLRITPFPTMRGSFSARLVSMMPLSS